MCRQSRGDDLFGNRERSLDTSTAVVSEKQSKEMLLDLKSLCGCGGIGVRLAFIIAIFSLALTTFALNDDENRLHIPGSC